jgi:hypothetical protein
MEKYGYDDHGLPRRSDGETIIGKMAAKDILAVSTWGKFSAATLLI